MKMFYHKFSKIETSINEDDLENWNCLCIHGSTGRFQKGKLHVKCIHYWFAVKELAKNKIQLRSEKQKQYEQTNQ
ncbi:hypothetical protein HYU06_01570 [Candidatus Woesearchaeota archaeon]|nr:hypothetical protein [Candidatus Woesearchaeota archaeon]